MGNALHSKVGSTLDEKLIAVQEHLKHLKLEMGMTWPEISGLPPMLNRIPIGTLSAIMYGRDPKDPVTREILGLDQHESCGQCWRFNQFINVAVNERRSQRKVVRWRDLPVNTLLLALENREDF
jgi:hypothetical protein